MTLNSASCFFAFFFFRQTLPAISTDKLMPVGTKAVSYDVIGIDEGQFVSYFLYFDKTKLVHSFSNAFSLIIFTMSLSVGNSILAISLIVGFICQFPDVVKFADHLANLGKIVIVAALDGTFQKKVCHANISVMGILTNMFWGCSCT